MTIMSTETITLGMQTSKEDNRTGPNVLHLRKLLSETCKGPYSTEVCEFALILRIGGEMLEFDFRGCEKIKHNKKGKYITVDVGFPSYEWKDQSDRHIREFLADAIETALKCCVDRLKRNGVCVDTGKLSSDYEVVRNLFLKMEQ